MYSIKSVDAAMSNALFRNRNEGFAAYHEGRMHLILSPSSLILRMVDAFTKFASATHCICIVLFYFLSASARP